MTRGNAVYATLLGALRWMVVYLKFILIPLYAVAFYLLFLEGPLAVKKISTAVPVGGEAQMAMAAYVCTTEEGGGASSGDEGGGLTGEESGGMAAYLLPGDILLGRCRMSLVPSLDPARGWTHAAIYVGGGDIMVASNPSQGVVRTSVEAWEYPEMTWVACLRVVSATREERERAAEFAVSKAGRSYDLNWFSEQADGRSWYCSELVWAAYYASTGGRVDLEPGLGLFGVSPDDIYRHDGTEVIGGHYERKPDTLLSLLAKAFMLCAAFGVAAEAFKSR